VRAEGLIENRPELVAAVRPLLEARKAIEQQVEDLDRKVHKLARRDVQVRRFMTVPGVSARSPHSASRRRSMIRRASSDREVLEPLSD
jgi:transposase